MSDTIVLRDNFALDDRTFTVLAEPWFDAATDEWKGRFLFVPLDRSLPRTVSTGPIRRTPSRDELVRWLRDVSDRDLARALRAVLA